MLRRRRGRNRDTQTDRNSKSDRLTGREEVRETEREKGVGGWRQRWRRKREYGRQRRTGGGRLGTEEAEGEKKPRKERGRRGGFRDDRLRRVGVG